MILTSNPPRITPVLTARHHAEIFGHFRTACSTDNLLGAVEDAAGCSVSAISRLEVLGISLWFTDFHPTSNLAGEGPRLDSMINSWLGLAISMFAYSKKSMRGKEDSCHVVNVAWGSDGREAKDLKLLTIAYRVFQQAKCFQARTRDPRYWY